MRSSTPLASPLFLAMKSLYCCSAFFAKASISLSIFNSSPAATQDEKQKEAEQQYKD